MSSFKMKNTRFLVYVAFLIFFVLSGHLICNAKQTNNAHRYPPSSLADDPKNDDDNVETFNVMSTQFGARGDGKTDDTNAFMKAWEAACGTGNARLLVPSGRNFLVQPILFTNCNARIEFSLQGNLIAPQKSEWSTKADAWITFQNVHGLTVDGSGILNGLGGGWWEIGGTRPTALAIRDSKDVTVTGITIVDSPQMHLFFYSCVNVIVSNVTITSPADSPNTDGIHLDSCQNVTMSYCDVKCGDDCISIQSGTYDVNIDHLQCGPSTRVSIGSLGKSGAKACVHDITVTDSHISGTQNGVRIKSWEGGLGAVYGVKFQNIHVSEVQVPIIIDQHYTDSKQQSSTLLSSMGNAVRVSNIIYQNILGTYKQVPVKLDCAQSTGCKDITLQTIHLQPSSGAEKPANCSNAYGAQNDVLSITCLKSDSSSGKKSYASSYGDSSRADQ